MKKIFILGFISIVLVGCFGSDEVKITNKDLNCQNHNWKNGYCEVIGSLGTSFKEDHVVNCILYYKNKPFTGTIKNWKYHKPTNHKLYEYYCEYVDGKRDGFETKETWYNNFPKTVETTRWWDNVKGEYSKVPFHF